VQNSYEKSNDENKDVSNFFIFKAVKTHIVLFWVMKPSILVRGAYPMTIIQEQNVNMMLTKEEMGSYI
jgi:hypothetical protein